MVEEVGKVIGKYTSADSLRARALALVSKFGGIENGLKIGKEHIQDINFVFLNQDKAPRWLAKICRLHEMQQCLGHKPLIMVVYQGWFDKATEAERNAVIFHELMHIVFRDGKYKLVQHDIQDFKFIVSRIGLNYEKAGTLFDGIAVDTMSYMAKGE